MKEFKFIHRGVVLSWKELMEKLNLNDESAVEIVIDGEKEEIIIYTELGSMSRDKTTNIMIKEPLDKAGDKNEI